MDKNIHNYTSNGRELDISINMNIDKDDKLCWHLIEIEKVSPSTQASTTSILHTKESSQRSRKDWELAIMAASRTKGCRLKYIRMGHNSTIVYFLSKFLLLYYFIVAQHIALQQEVKSQSGDFSQHMEGQGTSPSLLGGGKLQIFVVFGTFPYVSD